MSSALYLLGTTSVWLGVGLLLRAVFLMVRWRQAVGLDQASTGRAMLVAAIAGAAAILIGLMPLRPAAEGGWPVPLVWPFMPFAAWGSVVCGVASF